MAAEQNMVLTLEAVADKLMDQMGDNTEQRKITKRKLKKCLDEVRALLCQKKELKKQHRILEQRFMLTMDRADKEKENGDISDEPETSADEGDTNEENKSDAKVAFCEGKQPQDLRPESAPFGEFGYTTPIKSKKTVKNQDGSASSSSLGVKAPHRYRPGTLPLRQCRACGAGYTTASCFRCSPETLSLQECGACGAGYTTASCFRCS